MKNPKKTNRAIKIEEQYRELFPNTEHIQFVQPIQENQEHQVPGQVVRFVTTYNAYEMPV